MRVSRLLVCVLGLGVLAGTATAQALIDTDFTYQGNLTKDGLPLNSTADFEFTLWDALTTPPGAQAGGTVSRSNVDVTDGLFTVDLDFGVEVFDGNAVWLEVAVRSPAGRGTLTTLSPRQPLTANPYSLQTRGIFVDTAGNVGIGTSSPGAKLDVQGALKIVDGTEGDGMVLTSDANGVTGFT